jgi:hypothetical protein
MRSCSRLKFLFCYFSFFEGGCQPHWLLNSENHERVTDTAHGTAIGPLATAMSHVRMEMAPVAEIYSSVIRYLGEAAVTKKETEPNRLGVISTCVM